MNVARGGWGTLTQFKTLRNLVDNGYAPDAVVVVFFVNDATHLDSNPRLMESMAQRVWQRDGWLNRVSRAYDYLDYRRRRRAVTAATVEDYRRSFLGETSAQRQWERSRKALAAMKRLADEHGFRLGLVLFPVLVELHADHGLRDVYAEVEAACAELDVPYHSLLPAFFGRDGPSLWVSPVDAHPNAEANGLVVPPLEAFLVRAGIVP